MALLHCLCFFFLLPMSNTSQDLGNTPFLIVVNAYRSGQTIATSMTWLFQYDLACEIPMTWYLPDDLYSKYAYTHIHIYIHKSYICIYTYSLLVHPWSCMILFDYETPHNIYSSQHMVWLLGFQLLSGSDRVTVE